MSFLKKAGQVVLKIIGLWQGVAPLAGKLIPGAGEISAAVNAILTAEQMFVAAYGPDAKKGSDKLRAAVPFVAQLIQASEAFQGKTLKDGKLAEQAFTQITSALADLLNAYGE
jgi:hypothetical protein